MSSIKHHFKRFYGNVTNSIAFYPTLISIFFLLLSLSMLILETGGTFDVLRGYASFLFIDNTETARVILATLISGIISLTVFSFSMVMVLLNQASTNYSPRLLPGLISDKRNQGVLGIYIGSLIYNILVLISILPTENNTTGIGLSIFVGIVLGICCLGFFVFFIHTISTSIQVNNILRKTFEKAKKNLEDLLKDEDGEWVNESADHASWNIVETTESGYFQKLDKAGLLNYLEKTKRNIWIAAHKGLHILKSMPLLYTDQDPGKEEEKKIQNYFLIDKSIDIHTNYLLGIRYITEVGVKAMSPAVNDPRTAISTLDYLAELFYLRLKIQDYKKYTASDNVHYLIVPEVPFETLLHNTLAAYRTYGKHDYNLVFKLQNFLRYLEKGCTDNFLYKECIDRQISILQETYEDGISNKQDRAILKKHLD